MEFMIGMIFGIIVASGISWYLINKEMESLKKRNDTLQESMLLNYESNLLRREEILYSRIYKSFLQKENPDFLKKVKNSI